MISLNFNLVRNLGIITLIALALFSTCTPALAQQHVIANKDVTRPGAQVMQARPATINDLTANKQNGYNEITWSSRNDQDVQYYFVEYSFNGVDYEAAGQVSLHAGLEYEYQHYIQDNRPVLYRIGMLLKNNRTAHTPAILLNGVPVSPVKMYPTVVTGNTVNIESAWPIERMTIVSSSGQQVFSKDLNGQSEYIPVVIPSLGKGLYYVTFFGDGWRVTEKMIVS